MISRRTFFRTSAAAGVAALATGYYAWRVEPHWLEFTHHDMPVANLSESLRGARLIQISDTHVGERVDSEYLIASLRSVAAYEPDWIVVTGDFMSCSGPERIDEVARVFEALPQARFGRAAVLGNHDYGRHYRRVDVADALTRRLADIGIDVLSNESRAYGGLTITGLDDLWGPRFHPSRVLAAIDPTAANLVLCHNPDVCDRPVWGDYRGWILAGHTHGGQVKPPFLPPPILPVENERYTQGVFEVGPERFLYINRALGYLRRVRFNVRPEITVFRLT